MIFSGKLRVLPVIICSAMLTACTITSSPDICVERLAIQSVPLPSNWEETYRGQSGQQGEDIVDSWSQRWEPIGCDTFTGFSFSVRKFRSVAQAKKGYNQSLQRFYERGFKMEPLPAWAYGSDFADQYTMYCSWPETTGDFCYSVARYTNFVVILGLDPGDGITLEQAPELFGAVDQHIQAVITGVNNEGL